jgi:hypothetical protein
MLPLPLLHCLPIPAVSSVVAAGKFKVATPDVSVPVFISQSAKKPSYYLAKHIKVKAFSTSHS